MLPVTVARSLSEGNAICYIRYVLPVWYMMSFSHKEANGPKPDDAQCSSSSPGGGTGGEVCRLPLHPVFFCTSMFYSCLYQSSSGFLFRQVMKKQ